MGNDTVFTSELSDVHTLVHKVTGDDNSLIRKIETVPLSELDDLAHTSLTIARPLPEEFYEDVNIVIKAIRDQLLYFPGDEGRGVAGEVEAILGIRTEEPRIEAKDPWRVQIDCPIPVEIACMLNGGIGAAERSVSYWPFISNAFRDHIRQEHPRLQQEYATLVGEEEAKKNLQEPAAQAIKELGRALKIERIVTDAVTSMLLLASGSRSHAAHVMENPHIAKQVQGAARELMALLENMGVPIKEILPPGYTVIKNQQPGRGDEGKGGADDIERSR